MFTVIALVMTAVLVILHQVSSIMNAPEEAFDKTVAYVRICGDGDAGDRGVQSDHRLYFQIGDSRTPLFTVAVACVFNIAGDLIL